MNVKERNEIRRRIAPDKCAISRVYGCFVNGGGEIVARLDESLGLLSSFESEKYLSLLKKVLSGTLGKNLIDIVFSTQQVMEGEEHKLLSTLRSTKLADPFSREDFFQKVIQSADMGDQSYVILLAHDSYDVPFKGKDDQELADGSDTVYSYLLCAVCPVKEDQPELAYFPGENTFHGSGLSQIIAPPAFGFLFPAFDDRAPNIYNALYYAKTDEDLHQGFIDAIFHTQEPPMSAGEQKETFQGILQDALESECSYDVVQGVHEQMRELIQAHKDSKDPESLDLSPQDVSAILVDSGATEAQAQSFRDLCGQRFGQSSLLHPENLITANRFQIETPQVKISVDPAASYLVETRKIGGRHYLLIPADDGVEVNGVPVTFPKEEG
jgi:hypothetical protein